MAPDCNVGFEGRRYSVQFAHLGRAVTVHGCSRVVQVWFDGRVVAEHARRGRERVVIDPRHYEGEATKDVLPCGTHSDPRKIARRPSRRE